MAVQSAPPSSSIGRASAVLISPTTNNGGIIGLRRGYALKSSFLSASVGLLLPRHTLATAAAPKFSMRVAAKKAYICRDCGYIYNERTPFENKPDSYFCPVCGAPKRRFKPYQPPVTKDANALDVRKARKAQIKRDEALGNALPFAVVIGVAALAALYFYLNNTY